MRISYWSSDVCSSDLKIKAAQGPSSHIQGCDQQQSTPGVFGDANCRAYGGPDTGTFTCKVWKKTCDDCLDDHYRDQHDEHQLHRRRRELHQNAGSQRSYGKAYHRSEEHTSELQSLMRISYAVFCLQKKKTI